MFFSALKPKRPMLLSKRGQDENQVLIGWTRDIFGAQIFHVRRTFEKVFIKWVLNYLF